MPITTRPLRLAPQTHYEVLSRVVVRPVEEGIGALRLQDEYVEIGDFTTGIESDQEGPSIASVEVGPSPGECLVALTVVASDDHAAPAALRFGPSILGFLGPNLVLLAPAPVDGTGRARLSLVPTDPSFENLRYRRA